MNSSAAPTQVWCDPEPMLRSRDSRAVIRYILASTARSSCKNIAVLAPTSHRAEVKFL
jgi:hypothetical protein